MSFKLLLLQLGFTCSTDADKLRFKLSDSQCLRAFNRSFPLFFFMAILLATNVGNLLDSLRMYCKTTVESVQ